MNFNVEEKHSAKGLVEYLHLILWCTLLPAYNIALLTRSKPLPTTVDAELMILDSATQLCRLKYDGDGVRISEGDIIRSRHAQ